MTDWTDGYVADIDYTFGYYTELNPLRLRLAFLNVGLQFPEIGTACELGFGQGISTNIHAAASVVKWFGTDFNPAHTYFAQQLTRTSGAEVQLFEQSFIEFCHRDDLPDFDYIALHGIWTWISEENRTVILDFLHRKLKAGGVVYLSYNTQPGWATMMPMRDLLVEHADVMGTKEQGSMARFDSALQFAEKLLATKASYLQHNPQIEKRLAHLKTLNQRYLIHEYFNRHWQPLSFAKTAKLLATAKLDFACSAYYLDHVDNLNVTAEQLDLLESINNPLFRETVLDFCTNQQFRRDYWVKGAIKLTGLEQIENIRAERIVLIKPLVEVSFKVTGSLGESALHEAIYNPILEALSDYQIKTLAELEQIISRSQINFAQMIQALMVLIGAQIVSLAQKASAIQIAKTHTNAFNRHLCYKARSNEEVACLASPVTGGGIAVSRFNQLFLLAIYQGLTEPEQWARFVWPILDSQNQYMIKDGVALTTTEQNIAELIAQAQVFADIQLPVLKALAICD